MELGPGEAGTGPNEPEPMEDVVESTAPGTWGLNERLVYRGRIRPFEHTKWAAVNALQDRFCCLVFYLILISPLGGSAP